jgi:DNA-binding response OmpR family regulator
VREHLQDDPAKPSVVVTVRGVGYMLAPEDGS